MHFIASNFVAHPEILIFSVFKWQVFPILIANKIFTSLFFYAFSCNQFVAPEIHNSRRHCSIQCQGQNFDKKSLYLKGYTAKRLIGEFPERSWIKRGVNKLLKSWGTQEQLTGGQAAADLTVPPLKKTLRQ